MLIATCVLLLIFVFQQGVVVGRIVQCSSWGDPHVIPFPANETDYPREVWCQKTGLMWLVKNKYILSTVTVGPRPYLAYDFQFVFLDNDGLVICVVDGKQAARRSVPDCTAYGVNVILENRGVTLKYPKADFLATIIFSSFGSIDSIKIWLDSCLAKVSDGICNTGCSDSSKDCYNNVQTTTVPTTPPRTDPIEQKVQLNADQICEIFIQQALATLNFLSDDQRISLRTEIVNSKTACITDLTLTGDLKAATASILNLVLYKFTWNITSYTSLSLNFSTFINIAININIQIINTAIFMINETIIYPIPTVNLEQIHVDFDSPGNDLEVLTDITTRRKCVEKCLNTSKCIAVAYRLSDGVCFLKDCITRLTVRVGTDIVHLAVGKQGQVFSGLEAPDNNLRNLTSNNLTINKCIEECKNNSLCVGISFRYADRMCFLKYIMSQLILTPGFDTVYIKDPHSCNPACRNGGTCKGNNTCVCLKGYTGPACAVQSFGLCTEAEIGSSTPIVSITFGAGTSQYSNSIPANFDFTTTYQQKFADPVEDKMFGLVNSIPTNRPAWHGGAYDHTGNRGGYMLFVNANFQPDEFYDGTVTNLTVGVQYQFSVWAANVVKAGSNLLPPQVLFEVRSVAAGNTLLAQINSGSIPEYSNLTWKQYGLSFVAPTTSVVLLMISNAPGGNGNDLVLDDIELRRCSRCAPFWRMPTSQQTTYSTYPNANTCISGDSSRSLCAWFRVSSFNIESIIVDIGSTKTSSTGGCNTHFTLLVTDSTHIRLLGMCDMFNTGPIFVGPDTLFDNAFHQICVTYNSTNARLCTYRDFQQPLCITRNSRPYNTSLGDIRIGWWPDENYQFVTLGGGLIRSVSLFESEISQDCIIDEINKALTINGTTNITTTPTLNTTQASSLSSDQVSTYIRDSTSITNSTLFSTTTIETQRLTTVENTVESSATMEQTSIKQISFSSDIPTTPTLSIVRSTFVSSSVTLWTTSTDSMPIVANDTYILFTLSFSINNEDLIEVQLESDLRSIFISALDIYPNQIDINVNIPSMRTVANLTAKISLFDSVLESADSLLARIHQQLGNSSSALRHYNLTSQLTNESISGVKRIYICNGGSKQETPCSTKTTTSENSLTRVLLASIIPSILGGIIFGVVIALIVKHIQQRHGNFFFFFKRPYPEWTRF